ncbi:hypothetical protein [Arthrobacter sp. HLT1-20]
MSAADQPPLAFPPDSPDIRLLVDLTSHASDLSEASHTLRLALEAGEGEPLWFPLTMQAVTAYVRPFVLSNVRKRLDQMPQFTGIPAELQSLHDTIRKYRNTTVAHSQSDLTMPVAVALLNEHGTVRDVQGWTLQQPMPGSVANDFELLIDAVQTIIEDATRPVADRLRERFRGESAETIAAWPKLEFIAARDNEFSGTRQRPRAPRFTTYWRIDSEIVPRDAFPNSQGNDPLHR